MASMHGGRLPAGKTLRAIPASGGLHLCEPAAAARDRAAEELGQYQARPDHASQYLLEGRRARRLPEGILEIRMVAAAARRYREPDFRDADRASFDHVRARSVGRPAERIELFAAAAPGLRSRRVTGYENAGAVVPFVGRFAGFDAGARRARPGRRQPADQGAARIHAGPRTCPRWRSLCRRCISLERRFGRPRHVGGRGIEMRLRMVVLLITSLTASQSL